MTNPPLILVSTLFFLALVSVFYLGSWITATLILRLGASRLSHCAAKRVLISALVLPPLLAAVPTISGATLRHSHASESVEHHSMMCQQMFTHVFATTSVLGNGAIGVAVNIAAWLLMLAGVVLMVRLLVATARLESGVRPYPAPPSDKLAEALSRCNERIPGLAVARFSECPVPAAYSSVLGFWRVRCILSREFVAIASEDELDAVIAHEAAHMRSGDVRATLLVGLLNCWFFYLRPVRLLSRRWREAAELASDDAAVVSTRNPLALAAAILRVSGVPVRLGKGRSLPATTLAFADEAACPPAKRVERLIAQAEQAALPPTGEPASRVVAGWLITCLLAGIGVTVLLSAQAACYAHCSLEAVARLFP